MSMSGAFVAPSSGPPAKANLSSVQVLRGLAAIAVVVFHCGSILAQPEYGGEVLFAGWTVYGKLGVNLFFLLSGFIIFKAHRDDLGRRGSLPRYAFRRLVRIYPIYWVVLTINIAVSALNIGHPDFSWAMPNLVSAYLLMPFAGEVTLPLKVAWSLFYEIEFYLLFALALLVPRLALGLAVVWCVAIAGAALAGISAPFEVLSPWNLYFLTGMAVCWFTERLGRRLAPAFLAAAVLMTGLFFLLEQTAAIQSDGVTATTYWFLPIFAALVTGAVLLEPAERSASSPLRLAGDASYSIYLIHTMVISGLALAAHSIGLDQTMGGYGFFFLTLFAALAVGLGFYATVEKPLLHLLKTRLGPGRSKTAEIPHAASGG